MHLSDQPLKICCVKTSTPARQYLTNLGKISILVHIAGFLFGVLPFLIYNVNIDIPGFFGFIIIPTVIILGLGTMSGVLIIDSINMCTLQSRLCISATFAIISAVFHFIFAFVESIVFWTAGLSGAIDIIAGLLLLKNILCAIFESLTASAAISAQSHMIN
mgnify:CR=1 FL=1|tara:strand:- start:55 stop:537 length:483 start_codon:yes stop_codon:yes gene_type:complete